MTVFNTPQSLPHNPAMGQYMPACSNERPDYSTRMVEAQYTFNSALLRLLSRTTAVRTVQDRGNSRHDADTRDDGWRPSIPCSNEGMVARTLILSSPSDTPFPLGLPAPPPTPHQSSICNYH